MIGVGGGCGLGLGPLLQTRLMDVADEAQTLAAALNYSAFNVANGWGRSWAAWAGPRRGWWAQDWRWEDW